MKIGIIVAMESEFNLIKQILTSTTEQNIHDIKIITGENNNKSIILVKSGIGKVNSALRTLELINNFHPDYIINTGIAGGIDQSLKVMDIVLGQNIVYHDVWCGDGNCYGQVQDLPAQFQSNTQLLQIAQSYSGELTIHSGLICSGDKFITDQQQLSDIKQKFPQGLAVDMESCSIAQTCYLYNIPYLSLRIISDTPGNTNNHAQQYANFWNLVPEKSLDILKHIIAQL